MESGPLHVLLAEDDPKVAHSIGAGLGQHGIHVIRCETGGEAIARFDAERVDVVVLDLGLPDMGGMEVLARIRSKSPSIPVLILTAQSGVDSRIGGLDGGADDYLVKPFAMAELRARVRALGRRVELGRKPTLSCGDLEIDIGRRTAVRAGRPLDLSPRELDLLQYLLERQGQVVTRAMLASDVWQYRSRATSVDNIIDVQMSRLRDKVDKPYPARLIQTVRGVGFTIREPR